MKTIKSVYLHNHAGSQEVKLPVNTPVVSAIYTNEGISVNYEYDEDAEKKNYLFYILTPGDLIPESTRCVTTVQERGAVLHVYQSI